jgi:hypothetical protein
MANNTDAEYLEKVFGTVYGSSEQMMLDEEALLNVAHPLAEHILSTYAPSRERSLALTKLEECLLWLQAHRVRTKQAPVRKDTPDD